MFNLHASNQDERHIKILKELQVKFDRLEGGVDALLKQHQITLDEFMLFLSNPACFEKEAWEALQQARKEFDQKLNLDVGQIKNRCETEQKYRDLGQARQWISVR